VSVNFLDPSKMDRKTLIDFLKTADSLDDRYSVKKYDSYIPHSEGEDGGQLAFHKAAGTHVVRVVCTGNRYGKTTAAVNEIKWLATGTHPYRHMKIPNRGKFYGESFSWISDVLEPKLKEWINPNLLDPKRPYEYNNQGGLTQINWACGSITRIGTYEQDSRKAEGSNWDYCVAKGQRVLLSDGSWVNIEDLKIGQSIISFAENKRRMKANISNVIYSGEKEVFKVKTKGGHTIQCTKDHKLYSGGSFKKLEEIKVGDKIYYPIVETKDFDKDISYQTISEDQAFLIASWIGDGWYSGCVFIAGEDNFIDYLRSRYSDDYFFHKKQRYDHRVTAKKGKINWLKDFLKAESLLDKKAKFKFIPDIIFKQSEAVKCAFLSGLFSTDGWVSSNGIGFGSTSFRLADDVKKLLSSVGIYASIYHKNKQDENWSDQKFVMISKSKQVRKFARKIFLPIKNGKLLDKIAGIDISDSKRLETLYSNFGKEKSKRSQNEIDKTNKKNEVLDINWREIVSITSIGVKDTYDITVEKYHNFICEGFLVHNCGFDEPPKHELWVGNFRGIVDNKGIIWITATPLSEPWIYDELWLKGLSGEKPYVKCFRGKSSDNKHIPKEMLDLYFAEIPDEMKPVRFNGEFSKLSGLVINTYNPMLSDIDEFELDANYAIYEGIDPHSNKPHAVLWKAVDRDGFRYTVREMNFDGTMAEFALKLSEVREDLERHGAKVVRSVIDSAVNQKDFILKTNVYKELCNELNKLKSPVIPKIAVKGKGSLDETITRLKDLYRPAVIKKVDTKKVEEDIAADPYMTEIYGIDNIIKTNTKTLEIKVPKQYIFKDRCPMYRKELLRYRWPKDSGDKDVVKPVDDNNEFISCDRYIEQLNPRWIELGTSRLIRTPVRGRM